MVINENKYYYINIVLNLVSYSCRIRIKDKNDIIRDRFFFFLLHFPVVFVIRDCFIRHGSVNLTVNTVRAH